MNVFYPLTGHLVENADKNRQNPTEAERHFIDFCEQLNIPYKYQVPIYCSGRGYVLDFELTYEYSTKKKIKKAKYVVEIDGEYHDTPEQRKKDTQRTMDLIDGGYKKVIRIKNEDTWTNYSIFNALYDQLPKESKVGSLYAAYLKEKYNNSVNETSWKNAFEAVKEKVYISGELDKLKQENEELRKELELLKDVNKAMAEEVYRTELQRDYWKKKVETLDKQLWTLSVSTGNFKYYCTEDRRVESNRVYFK